MMNKLDVEIIVCGRFHYHKYLKYLEQQGVLKKFIYSYKIQYNFSVSPQSLKNLPVKEYLMYFGMKFLKGRSFYQYLSFLHKIWQLQVCKLKPQGNVMHFLVHGNCYKIIEKYRAMGVKVIGEVVNVHPDVQAQILQDEYAKYGLSYDSGEVSFRNKIIKELDLCDFILVPSNYIKQTLIQKNISASKIKVLPYGLDKVNHQKKSSYIDVSKEVKIIYVGQITFRKGVVYLLRAISLLQQRGISVKLTLVGKMDSNYAKVVNDYLQSPQIVHISHINNADVYEKMIEHDLLVMPSLEDGFGVVVSEALSVRLPVIVTNSCGASEVVQDKVNGFVIQPGSEMAIVNAIIASIEYNFIFPDNLLNWKEYATELSSLYTEII